MADDKNTNIETTDESTVIVENSIQELAILVTEADKYGTDITEMSNFSDIYIQQLSYELSTNSAVDVIESIPIADLGIIYDVVNHAELVMKGSYGYVADFDSLPHDIKIKLEKGIYKVAESKQVDGNMRAVILDENDVRFRDITLKHVKNNPDTLETTRSIANQIQMRQIYAKLDDIHELQSYQIDRDRDRDIVVPFLNARDYILHAQSGGTLEEKKENLKVAKRELTAAVNSVYTDMSTASKHLTKLTSRPIFRNKKQITSYIDCIERNLHLAAMYVGVQMQVFDYLGDKEGSKLAFESYKHFMQNFASKNISKGLSAAMLMHMNYQYNESNKNLWYQFAIDVKPVLQEEITGAEIYLVGVEDISNENE